MSLEQPSEESALPALGQMCSMRVWKLSCWVREGPLVLQVCGTRGVWGQHISCTPKCLTGIFMFAEDNKLPTNVIYLKILLERLSHLLRLVLYLQPYDIFITHNGDSTCCSLNNPKSSATVR